MRIRKLLVTGLLIGMGTSSWGQLSSNASWPSFGKDYGNTRKTDLGAPTNGSVRWQYTYGGRTFSSPIVGPDGTIYYGSPGGVVAVWPNGTRRWLNWTNQYSTAWSAPALSADGKLYIIANPQDAILLALDASNGALLWSLYLGGTNVRSSPAIGPDGRIYVTNGEVSPISQTGGYLYCINPDGTVAWRRYLDTEANSIPAFGPDGTIYVGSARHLNAIHPDGTILWRYPTFYPVQGTIVYVNNRIFFTSWDAVLRCVNPSGQLLWHVIIGGIIETGVATDGQRVYVCSNQGELRCYTINGALQWRASIAARNSTPAIGSDGTIYLIAANRVGVYAINPQNGLTRWVYFLNLSTPYSSPAIGGDGTVYVLEATSRLIAFGPLLGGIQGNTKLEGWLGNYEGLPVLVEFYQDGELKYEMETTLDSEGNFQLFETPVGEHEIKVRVHRSLRGSVPNVHLETDQEPEIRVILGNGDLNGDNIVDDNDLLIVLLLFGEYSPEYDLTGDTYIDEQDLLIVLFNFGATGD